MAASNGSTSDLKTIFLKVYSVLKSEILQDPAFEPTEDSYRWVERMLDYNVPGGGNGPLMVVVISFFNYRITRSA